MKKINWQIPDSVLKLLKEIPKNKNVSMLIRHSVRYKHGENLITHDILLTPKGKELAFQLGKIIGKNIQSIYSSPIERCVQTGKEIANGANKKLEIIKTTNLGLHGVYVLDSHTAGQEWRKRGHLTIMDNLSKDSEPFSGFAYSKEAAQLLLRYMLNKSQKKGINVFITHDSLISTTVANIASIYLPSDYWPKYLEAAFFWEENGKIQIRYKDISTSVDKQNIFSISKKNVEQLAYRYISKTIGLDADIQIFLAGGVFTTLLTGKPPRDLDFWAPTKKDRVKFINLLLKNGAKKLPNRPYTNAYSLNNMTIEIKNKTDKSTLKAVLESFDIALSSIGVEFNNGNFSSVIHPLAYESISRKEVLLLKPLANKMHILSTLKRLYNYSKKLNFHLPKSEIDEIWNTFDKQSLHKQKEIIENFENYFHFTAEIKNKAISRLKNE